MSVVIKPAKFTDPDGVTYFISAGGTVFLELDTLKEPKEGKREKEQKRKHRKIAHYDFYTKTLSKQEKGRDGLFVKGLAFGFPYHLCKFLHTEPGYGLKWLVVNYSGKVYRVSAEEFFKKGYFLNFKKKGIELRMFLEISNWEVL